MSPGILTDGAPTNGTHADAVSTNNVLTNDVLINGSSTSADSSHHSYLPVPDGLDTFWFRDGSELHDHRSTSALPKDSDVVIIGAGFAGVATAYHLLKVGPADLKVTILEARGTCSGATGRNGGHLRPDMYGHIPNYVARAGARAGAEIAEFEIANLWAVKKVIEEEEIDCDFTLARSVDVWCNEEAARSAEEVYKQMVAHQFQYMQDVYFTSDPKQAEGYSGVKGARAAASFTAGTMWPYKFVLSLLKILLASGRLNLQTFTPVTSVSSHELEGCTIETARGTIAARRVVHASNAYVSGLLPEYEQNIIPCKGICCHIDVPADSESKLFLFNNSYIIRTESKTLSYLIPRTDGSIVVGGAASKFQPFRKQWYGNVDDSVLIDSAKDYYEGYMQRTYRGWENSGAFVSKIWTGVMGYSFDSNPHIGPVPGKASQYIAAGFNGHGMPVIWLSALGVVKQLVADMEQKSITFVETGLPRLFQTTQHRIDRARNNKPEDGDILGGDGSIFLPTHKQIP